MLSLFIGVMSPGQFLHSWVKVHMVLCICSVCAPETIGLGRLMPHGNPESSSKCSTRSGHSFAREVIRKQPISGTTRKQLASRHSLQFISCSLDFVHMVVGLCVPLHWILHVRPDDATQELMDKHCTTERRVSYPPTLRMSGRCYTESVASRK